MSLTAVLHHVQRTRTCGINPAALRVAESWIADRRSMVERSLDRLGEYLAETADQPEPTSDAQGQQ